MLKINNDAYYNRVVFGEENYVAKTYRVGINMGHCIIYCNVVIQSWYCNSNTYSVLLKTSV